MKIKIPEKDIQKAILEYLTILENLNKVYVVRVNSFAGKIERYDGSKGYIKNNKQGCPDIIICARDKYGVGRWVGIEVKSNVGGKQSDLQKTAEVKIGRAGGIYLLATSADDVEKLLKSL